MMKIVKQNGYNNEEEGILCNRKRNRKKKKNDNIENYNHRDVNESINLNNVFNL